MEYKNIVLPNYNHCILSTITSILKYYGVESKHASLPELDEKLSSKKYKNVDVHPQGMNLLMMKIQSKSRFYFYQMTRIGRAVLRRIRLLLGGER